MKVRIVGDGTMFGTKLLGVMDDGREEVIENVASVEWSLSAGLGRAVVRIDHVGLDVCGEYASAGDSFVFRLPDPLVALKDSFRWGGDG